MFEAYGFIAAENEMDLMNSSSMKQIYVNDTYERSSDSASSDLGDNIFEEEYKAKKVLSYPINGARLETLTNSVPLETKQDIQLTPSMRIKGFLSTNVIVSDFITGGHQRAINIEENWANVISKRMRK